MNAKQIAIAISILGFIPAVVSAQTDEYECGLSSEEVFFDKDAPLFYFDDNKYRETDLPEALQMALYDAELQYYKQRLKIVDAALFEIGLDGMAKESSKTKDQLTKELLAVPPVSDDMVNSFYEDNRARIPYQLDQVRDQIRQMIADQVVQSRRAIIINKARQHESFEIAIKKPVAPVVEIATEGFPSKGSSDPKVTLVEFADYQCPHCKIAASSVKAVLGRFKDVLRVVYMDFPINKSGISRTVSEGAVCADQQNSFWLYHDLAFERQEKLDHNSPLEFAKELGLDVMAFESCLKSTVPAVRVAKAEEEAERLGLSATPTLFLNGRRLHLHDLERELEQEVEKALGTQSS